MKAHCGHWWRIAVACTLLLKAAPLCPGAPTYTPQDQSSAAQYQSSTQSTSAQPVVSVRIVTEDGRVISPTPTALPVQPHKELNPDQIAESIRILYRSGDYADVRAISTPADGGVEVDFVVREQLFFNGVLIRGLTAPPTEASAIAALQLPLGEPYQADRLKEGVERLRQVLREEGLYASQVSATTVPHSEDRQMDIIVDIQPGARARISRIELENGTEYTDAEILSRAKIKIGKALTSARIERGVTRIRKFLVKKDRLNARAVARRGEYDQATNTVPLKLEVTEGPRVRIAVAGAKFSSGELRKLVPIYQEGAVDTDLLEEGKRNIRERLEREGYYDADVQYTTTSTKVPVAAGHKGSAREEPEQLITYTVERGDRHRLLGIEISGNHYFNTELLRSRLQIYASAFATRARFSRRLLEADRDSMRNLYLANGFLDAVVDAQALDNYHGKEGDLLIRFVVQEGKQTRVGSLEIGGAHAFSQDFLLGVI